MTKDLKRMIFHFDCNNFFASCECLERPELKDVPMAVEAAEQINRFDAGLLEDDRHVSTDLFPFSPEFCAVDTGTLFHYNEAGGRPPIPFPPRTERKL